MAWSKTPRSPSTTANPSPLPTIKEEKFTAKKRITRHNGTIKHREKKCTRLLAHIWELKDKTLGAYAYWRLCSLELLQTPPELLQTPLEVFQGPLEQLWAQLELSPAPLELFMLFLSRNIKLRCFCRENLKISLRSRKFGYFQVRSGCLILYLPVRK